MNILIAGAAPDTSNLGVSALLMSTLYGVLKVFPEAQFSVFDNGTGVRTSQFSIGDREAIPVSLIGIRSGKKFFHPGNLYSLSFLIGSKISKFYKSETLKSISEADVLLDISGGDSFSDIYGSKRYFEITAVKHLAAKLDIPVILLPQTYGPYKTDENRNIAESIVRNAEVAMARDTRSFSTLKSMLGDRYDPKRHVDGVDIAFSLPVREPVKLDSALRQKVTQRSGGEQFKLGLNISGLVYQDKQRAIEAFGFKADYNQILRDFVRWILEETKAELFLISHVMEPEGHYESDWDGSKKFIEDNDLQSNGRVHLLPRELECDEVKWVVSNMDWFCGMRMHSTIAGLSTTVPTASIAYSDKTLGVFETCGQEKQVFDPRKEMDKQILESLISSVGKRQETKQQLATKIPTVIQRSADQFTLVAKALRNLKV